ncbi:hypothetical protein O0I10_012808 [Lichtheimia ornata]|uniref:Uncharacterized protein n=1 Tax=Lichtheimia ornata TaxID=688661 RepID=A0AAD7XPA0_9FUNG|nr:uncharacterized protein O0I10_012808 [Lichtheimia ornata]KAJ8651619.1 hypothetical protein O0I10_012808 [Lichtheimia ornata]
MFSTARPGAPLYAPSNHKPGPTLDRENDVEALDLFSTSFYRCRSIRITQMLRPSWCASAMVEESKHGMIKWNEHWKNFLKITPPLITIICQVRNMMKATIEAIESDTSIIIPTINSSSTSPIPPSLPPPIKYQRKRKIAETDS